MTKGWVETKADIRFPTYPRACTNLLQSRCGNCGLEWESSHNEEICPLEELEIIFLSEEWFEGELSEAGKRFREYGESENGDCA